MKFTKNRLSITELMLAVATIAIIAALALPQAARAEVGTIDFGITNIITAAATNTGTAYVTNTAKTDNVDNVDVMFTGAGNAAGTGTIRLTFFTLPDGTTSCTNWTWDWTFNTVGAAQIQVRTNFPATIIGSAGAIGVYASGNANASCSVTNARLKLIKKNKL